MTGAERLKKRFEGKVPHKADKKVKNNKRKVVPYGFLQDPRAFTTIDPKRMK